MADLLILNKKNILIGVTGSIAAYKTSFLIRLLIKAGAHVKVIMTPASRDFITPLTLSTLSKNPVSTDFFEKDSGQWNSHVKLGLWADAMLIAPASANTIAKMAHGICDNLLLATYLSAKCPVYYAPSMDLDMYQHPSTLKNIEQLKHFGNIILPPNTGELASGLHGEGRMAEPEEIIEFLSGDFTRNLPLSGKKALVTAGPTYEAIDPVRFIGNHSSGKMGFAIAEELAKKGADVMLVCGPNALCVEHGGIQRINVTSAEEMYKACTTYFKNVDIAVMAAAIADYTPKEVAKQKIKKHASSTFEIKLEPTKDVLAELGQQKTKQQIIVGFALETENEIENAKAKIKKKNLDFIVLNSLNNVGAGFGTDTNKISIIDSKNTITDFSLKSKEEVAKDIVERIVRSCLKTIH